MACLIPVKGEILCYPVPGDLDGVGRILRAPPGCLVYHREDRSECCWFYLGEAEVTKAGTSLRPENWRATRWFRPLTGSRGSPRPFHGPVFWMSAEEQYGFSFAPGRR